MVKVFRGPQVVGEGKFFSTATVLQHKTVGDCSL